jgi:hypothetical protein
MGKCLEAPPAAAAGTRTRIWDCGGGANQQWVVNSNGTISSAQTGLCLDVNGGDRVELPWRRQPALGKGLTRRPAGRESAGGWGAVAFPRLMVTTGQHSPVERASA